MTIASVADFRLAARRRERALVGVGAGGARAALRSPRPLDTPAIALLADAWFPAPWPRLKKLAPAPTIDLTVHFRSPLPIDRAAVLASLGSA